MSRPSCAAAESALSTTEGTEQLRPVGCPPSRTSVPAMLGRVGAIVTGGDVSERIRPNEGTVDHRIEEPNRLTKLLVHQRDQPSPQGCYRTGPADHKFLPIDANLIARGRVCIPSDVGNPAAHVAADVCRLRYTPVSL